VARLFTIGHSTRTVEEFVSALKVHEVTALADIRAFPMSRHTPQFNRESLFVALQEQGIAYRWIPTLGGRRKRSMSRVESPNRGLRSESFRNYADYMLTDEFAAGIDELLGMAEHRNTAYMCAERVYFHCHRMLVSDWLVAHGHEVLHIDGEHAAKAHILTREARLRLDGKVVYSPADLFG
jgi:uncharacterized protein (DUF488 family)